MLLQPARDPRGQRGAARAARASTRARAATSPPPRSPQREAEGRPAALRLRGDGEPITIVDRLRGAVTRPADDIVLRRNDGVPAYHVAVVVDDDDQGVEEVVRADDLLDATPEPGPPARPARPAPSDAGRTCPLVLGPDGQRLAKRHGAVTLADLAAEGVDADEVRSRLAASLGLAEPGEPVTMAAAPRPLRPDRRACRLDRALDVRRRAGCEARRGHLARRTGARLAERRRSGAAAFGVAEGGGARDVARDLPGHERARADRRDDGQRQRHDEPGR